MYKEYEKVLCQDCLRVRDYTHERHNEIELCQCGGQFCGCPSCVDTINALISGKRKADEVGCTRDLNSWNEQDGIVKF